MRGGVFLSKLPAASRNDSKAGAMSSRFSIATIVYPLPSGGGAAYRPLTICKVS